MGADVTGIVEFLSAQLDEDRRYAHAASGLLGVVKPWYPWSRLKGALPGMSRADCQHIERQSPTRVLAEVAAKRRILALHEMFTKIAVNEDDEPVVDGGYCTFCQMTEGVPDGDWPCDTLKLLAVPYFEHAGYKPSWSVPWRP